MPYVGNLSLYLSLVSAIILFYNAILNFNRHNKLPIIIFGSLQLLFLFIAMFALIWCYVTSDFSVLNVVQNSHRAQPLIYKISAAWANHEGSLLLWLIIFNFFTFLFIIVSKKNISSVSNNIYLYTVMIQSILNICFLLFTIFISNPFEMIFPSLSDGVGLNPILQDASLSFHPPILYIGYIGLCLPYSIAVASLLVKGSTKEDILSMEAWVFLAWSFLTLGIGLGSMWAYRELGWGGFWFWDPVENASLIPWLIACGLIHCIMEYKKNHANSSIKNLTLLFSILGFASSLTGTFFVRSGIIDSIHSFARDPKRGIPILIFLTLMVGLSLLLYCLRSSSNVGTVNRYRMKLSVVISSMIFGGSAFVILIGTISPLITTIFYGEPVSVAANFYNKIIGPISVFGIVSCLFFNKNYWVKKENIILSCISFLISLIITFKYNLEAICIVVFLSISLILMLMKNLLLSFKKKSIMPSNLLAMLISHMGFAVLIAAIFINSILHEDKQYKLKVGEEATFRQFQIKLSDVYIMEHENYFSYTANIILTTAEGNVLGNLHPEIRFFPAVKQHTIETSIWKTTFYDIYIVMEKLPDQDDQFVFSVMYRPMIGWIWLSCILFFIAGVYRFCVIITTQHIRFKKAYSERN